ncbi:hypothetical protein V6N13_047791 [Hibiscus sabdariffa]|uniref:FAS1 domain-containing protein n=1 Tax=Hibiscus sabdariffa TaxID=183260 RepID=A0ABR2F587_9ROSI
METLSLRTTTIAMLPLLILLFAAATTTFGVTTKELYAVLLSLRSRGYALFPNAVTTSDLKIRLLSSQNSSTFTLFAPSDSFLFSLDLLSSARLYTVSLFLHVSPHFLSSSDLLALPRPAFIDTLLPNRQLLVERTMFNRNGVVLEIVTVDGVVVSVPDLFIGSHITVHGLDGILAYGSLGSDTDNNITIVEPQTISYQNSSANSPGIFPRSLHRAGSDKDLLISAMVGPVFVGFLDWAFVSRSSFIPPLSFMPLITSIVLWFLQTIRPMRTHLRCRGALYELLDLQTSKEFDKEEIRFIYILTCGCPSLPPPLERPLTLEPPTVERPPTLEPPVVERPPTLELSLPLEPPTPEPPMVERSPTLELSLPLEPLTPEPSAMERSPTLELSLPLEPPPVERPSTPEPPAVERSSTLELSLPLEPQTVDRPPTPEPPTMERSLTSELPTVGPPPPLVPPPTRLPPPPLSVTAATAVVAVTTITTTTTATGTTTTDTTTTTVVAATVATAAVCSYRFDL